MKGILKFPERCRIVAVCDIYEEKAIRRIEQYNLTDAVSCADYKVIADMDVDLVSVCTPPYTHAQIAIDLLRSGKHVLVEKPMASSLEECDAMITAAKESGKVLSVVAQNRFRTPLMNLKTVIDSGLAGKILHA